MVLLDDGGDRHFPAPLELGQIELTRLNQLIEERALAERTDQDRRALLRRLRCTDRDHRCDGADAAHVRSQVARRTLHRWRLVRSQHEGSGCRARDQLEAAGTRLEDDVLAGVVRLAHDRRWRRRDGRCRRARAGRLALRGARARRGAASEPGERTTEPASARQSHTPQRPLPHSALPARARPYPA
jgi:hypothetical protein